MRFFNGLNHIIGRTPLVKTESVNNSGNNIFLKLEFFNPVGSVKDRAGKYILQGAEKENLIGKGARLVEPTSGNTGIALAALCTAKDYNISLVMPSSMSVERQKLLRYFGADLILTDAKLGMAGAIDKAREMISTGEADFMPDQFSNKYNAVAHYETTGPEIFDDLDGNIDIFIAGVGTGGTITGVGRYLKERNKNVKIIAVEPYESQVLSGKGPAPHLIQGIGAGFIPELLDKDVLDDVVAVPGEKAVEYSRKIAKQEGILCGISSGAAIYASEIVSEKFKDKSLNIVTVLPSTGERYLSTKLFDI